IGPESDQIILTEGVFDAVSIHQNCGLTAWARTNGAGAFPQHLVSQLRGKTVFLMVDSDKAGRKGSKKIADMLAPWARVQMIELPRRCKDPAEYFARGGTAKEFKSFLKVGESTGSSPLEDLF